VRDDDSKGQHRERKMASGGMVGGTRRRVALMRGGTAGTMAAQKAAQKAARGRGRVDERRHY
jgi:hypothetical protein